MRVLFVLAFTFGVVAVPPLMVIDLGYKSSPSLATKIAAQVCVGLFNRDETVAGPAYTLMNSRDVVWLEDIEGISHPNVMSTSDFLAKCLRTQNSVSSRLIAKGYIRYNVTLQQLLVPNIITLAAVLDAVPLEDGHPDTKNTTMVFDALKEFDGFSAYNATSYMHKHYVDKTTAIGMMNPGLDVHGKHPFDPPITGKPNPGLVDYIVKERLFNFFLNLGCIPGTQEHALMEKIVTDNRWPRPISVYGYNDAFGIVGDIYEAETNCNKEHNMGQIASNGCNNLAFFSRKPSITTPLVQNADPQLKYNKSKTYMVFVVGDGDNVNFMKGSRQDWIKKRVKYCAADPSYKNCFPLLWSVSPQTLHLAPDMLKWYYNQSHLTKNDYFVLPPSGDLYSYPSMMSATDQASFVANTERDCFLMNTSATVAWEWTLTWTLAINKYFPRYTQRDIVRGFFAVNVPFNLPVLDFGENEYYKIFEKKTVLFKPREWRGTGGSSIPFSHKNYLTVKEMAAEINGYPKGTVSNIYLTSDGGANLDTLYKLVPQLDEHVQIVNHNTIVDFALQRG